jgi:hypothetical protein
MYPRSVRALQAGASFVSALQRSDEPNASQIRRAVMVTLNAYRRAGCAGRVAQEFGDHPETAAVQMRWARATVAIVGGHPVPGTRQMATVGSSASGRDPAAGLSAISSGRTETVTLVVIHDLALRYIAAAAATSSSPSNGTAYPNAVPYLFDQPAARRAAASLPALTSSAQSQSDH